MPQASTELEHVGEFGPFDVLSDWAHRSYVDGLSEQAVLACRAALLVVEAAGDVRTSRFLRYVEGIALLELGRCHDAITAALDLLATLDDADPLWRAKGLGLLAEASAGAGEVKRAMEALAEASWLVSRHPGGTYGYLSASMAVAIALRSLYLFEQAEELLDRRVPECLGGAEVQVVHESALLHAHWAVVLELVGHHRASQRHHVRTAQLALRLERLAAAGEEWELLARAHVLRAHGLSGLGERAAAAALARAAAPGFRHRDELLESQLLHVVLGRDLVDRQRYDTAREHFVAAAAAAERVGRDVWAAAAVTELAEAEVARRGRHPAIGLWKRLFREALKRMWLEREARFAALADRIRLRDLAEEHRRVGAQNLEDPLTGLGNRRLMADRVDGSTERMAVVFLDVDHFKDVNDRFSHAVGDDVLQAVAALLRQNCRPQDDVVRYGGDEFVVLVRGEEAAAVAEGIGHRLQEAVRTMDWGRIAEGLRVTASIGVASGADGEQALAAADAALYAAKRAGRDRVVAA